MEHCTAVGRLPKPNGTCTHWPLDGEARIKAASRAFRGLADMLARARPPPVAGAMRAGGCIDLSVIADVREVDAFFEFIDTAASRLIQLQQDVADVANDYQTTGVWLGDAMASAWAKVQVIRPALRYASVLDEGHRVVAKDWLTADMQLLIAMLLRRAIRPAERLDLSAPAVRSDLDGPRQYEAVFQSVAAMLDGAGTLVGESTLFVNDIDLRLRRFREQVVVAVVSAHPPEPVLLSPERA
jgi:hypothetical protein